MNPRAALPIALCYLVGALGAPIEPNEEEMFSRHEETGGFYEGDMVMEERRNGLIDEIRRWPNNTVYYKIDWVFDAQHVAHILRAMKTIENASCVRFKPATKDMKAYIEISGEPTGCHSNVGYLAKLQRVNLQVDPIDKGCFRLGTIAHEFLHSLGFYHAQSTWNRDEYVLIMLDNITVGKEHNFEKRNAKVVSDFDTEYDYGSVLHYSSKAFSKNGADTIIPLKNTGAVMGQRAGMSRTDIDKLNLMYKCPMRK